MVKQLISLLITFTEETIYKHATQITRYLELVEKCDEVDVLYV